MEYLIDGLNVIKTSFIKKYEKYGIETAQEFLVNILEKYKNKHPSVEITLVFDGYSTIDFSRRRIKIIFSNEIKADEKMRKILESRKNKNEVFVVSNDREIGEFTKILGGNILKVNEFLEIVYPVERREKKEIKNQKDIDYRIKFKIEKELEKFYGEKIKKNRKENTEISGKRG